MRSAHERYTTRVPPADRRRTNSNAAACSLSTPRCGAGLSPCTERHSAGHAKQRAAGPRWPEEPLAQLSWASPRTAGAVASTGICDQACQSVARASPSRCCRTFVARQRGASRQAASQRRGSGHHTPVVADACVACDYWQCMVGCADRSGLEACRSRAVTRLSTGSPRSSPGSLPALLDLGALLHLRQHTSTGARSQPAHGGSEKDAIGDWEQRNDPSPGPGP